MENKEAALQVPDDSKSFLLKVKQAIEEVKSLSDNLEQPLDDLVSVYLSCPARIPAQRVIASFFESLSGHALSIVTSSLSKQVEQLFCLDEVEVLKADAKPYRHTVDTVAALLENFKLGEQCVGLHAINVLTFLVRAEMYFLSQVHKDVPPVKLNEVMHHCHVTIQTLNLVIQKTIVGKESMVPDLLNDTNLMTSVLETDLQILKNESFMMDCRCCCAMNIVLLLQIYFKSTTDDTQVVNQKFANLLLPNAYTQAVSSSNGGISSQPPWLSAHLKDSLNMENQSILTYLALVYGYIAMVDSDSILTPIVTNTLLYLDSLLPSLLSAGDRCTDTVSKSLYARTVNLWSNKLLSAVGNLSTGTVSENLRTKLCGQSVVMESLLQYVWTHWEDHMDIIRQSATVVFESVLKVHAKVIPVRKPDKGIDPFVQSLLDHLWTVSWSSRGKFNALMSCVGLVGGQELLKLQPELPTEIVAQLGEQALSCYASELYSTLYLAHLYELATASGQTSTQAKPLKKSKKNVLDKTSATTLASLGNAEQSLFLDTWVQPVTIALLSQDYKLRQNIIEYLLPKLLKLGDLLLSHMIQQLTKHRTGQGAVIMCLRRARVMGMLSSALQVQDSGLWCGQIHPETLKSALSCQDEQIRLDAFALVSENQKTTETITAFEFEMVKLFIPHNVNNQSPAYRQSFVALLKKFFFRMKESLGALRRNIKKEKGPALVHLTDAVKHYELFFLWLLNYLLSELYPGSAFARRTTCLALLTLMVDFFQKDSDGFSVPRSLSKSHIKTLLECLMDTFEENRQSALAVLTSYLTHCAPIWTISELPEVLHVALTLASSTRPQDCDSAVYLLIVLLREWERHRDTCVNIADLLPSRLHLWKQPSQVSAVSTQMSSGHLGLLKILLSLLDDQIAVAAQSLITAAAHRPMYPTLHCIRCILQEINLKSLPEASIPAMRDLIHHLINSCLLLSKVVSPVVQNSSPEGNIPQDAILGPGLNMTPIISSSESTSGSEQKNPAAEIPAPEVLSESVMLSLALVESMPEYLVVCCWRSIKEVSLTLGELCLELPIKAIQESRECGAEGTLLTLDQVLVIGAHFKQQLLESIHRGAFELAYAGFQLLCQMLWNHPSPAFHQLPGQWLEKVMRDIKSLDPETKLCATRRSAGVPFFVQAITSSEPASTGRHCLHRVMKELISLALESSDGKGGVSDDAQVHALNTLRALFRDARLGEEVLTYVADGLRAAVLGFKSQLWAVRNSSTLLLSALMTRMFGVKRSKDETAMSKKNCQTGRLFFHRYPSLYPFLLAELQVASKNIGERGSIHLHPSLYPVLLVLGRLFPSTLEGSDTNLSLSAFIPYIIRCSASPVLKTRVIAARALRPLVKKHQVVEVSDQLLKVLPDSDNKKERKAEGMSHFHGVLLQLQELLGVVRVLSDSQKAETVQYLMAQLEKKAWLVTRANPCPLSRQTAMEVVDQLFDLSQESNISFDSLKQLQDQLIQALLDFSSQNSKISSTAGEQKIGSQKSLCTQSWIPGYFEFEKTRAKLMLKYLKQIETFSIASSGTDRHNTSKRTQSEYESDHTSRSNDSSSATVFKGAISVDQMSVPNSVVAKTSSSSIVSPVLLSIVKCQLQSPNYEVRLEVLNALVSAVSGKKFVDSLDESDSSTSADNNFRDPSRADSGTDFLLQALSKEFVGFLLDMAWLETHHHCREKLFLLLASEPELRQYLSSSSKDDVKQLFSSILRSSVEEKRLEVKAALMKFSGHLIPLMYGLLQQPPGPAYDSLVEWTGLLRSSCESDESAELQIACSQVLLENTSYLLRDQEQRLGTLTYDYWSILAILLQDDDLEVKELASSVLSVILRFDSGSLHPGYALYCLPRVLIKTHGERDPIGVIKCLLGWILVDTETDIEDSPERLFDKGEMNTYYDHVTFTRCVLSAFLEWQGKRTSSMVMPVVGESMAKKLDNLFESKTQNHQDVPNSKEKTVLNESLSTLDICQVSQDSSMTNFILDSLSNVSKELGQLTSVCEGTDHCLNISRYQALCQTVFKAKAIQTIFSSESVNGNVLKALGEMEEAFQILISELNLTNTLMDLQQLYL